MHVSPVLRFEGIRIRPGELHFMSLAKRPIRKIVILGGGSAGWMTAAALSTSLQKVCEITLIESEEIGTVGVGEATIPPIKVFNRMLGIDEATFVRETKGTFKLGIQFVDWAALGNRYFHPFGTYGRPFDLAQTHAMWLEARSRGLEAPFDDHCMAWAAAKAGRFGQPATDPRNVLSTFDYAYHFDAGLYAAFLRRRSEAAGVVRLEGKVAHVGQNSETGFVESLTLEDGRTVDGELFIDCSGFRGVLIEGALKTGYEDWTHWLPCDRALAVPCELKEMTPYTRSTADVAGWRWRIPLQHRTGNGYVYSSAHISDETAATSLLANLDGAPLGEPRPLRFVTGKRKAFWSHNVVAIGLSSGFMEPLESTSLHLIQAGISKLLAFFPDLDFDPLTIREFNRISDAEFERIRDFLILHYKLTTRTDSALWRDCAAMSLPDSLEIRIEHFRRYGRIVTADLDLFGPPSWQAVHIGQQNWPERVDPILAYRTVDADDWLSRLRAALAAGAQSMPPHKAYVEQVCRQAS